MAINLWGASPLYENESLKGSSIPTVTLIDKILDEGNCVRVTERGKEASKRSIGVATGSDIRQSCEATDRNLIQGRWGEVSEPTITNPFSFILIGKSGVSAAKVNRFILGRLEPVSGSRPCAQSRSLPVKAGRRFQFAAEAVVLIHRKPAVTGRAEL